MSYSLETLNETLRHYRHWLNHRPLSATERRTAASYAAQFLTYLMTHCAADGDPLRDRAVRDAALGRFKEHLLAHRYLSPVRVRRALAAIGPLFLFLGLDQPCLTHRDLPVGALEPAERVAFGRAIAACPSSRDRAMALLFIYAGLSIQEVAALNLAAVVYAAAGGALVVPSGASHTQRELPLHQELAAALAAWQDERARRFVGSKEPALFLSFRGQRLSSASIERILRQLGTVAGVNLTPDRLRRTFLALLVEAGADLIMQADLAGYRQPSPRYSLPSPAERRAVIERLQLVDDGQGDP